MCCYPMATVALPMIVRATVVIIARTPNGLVTLLKATKKLVEGLHPLWRFLHFVGQMIRMGDGGTS